jgi:hypothetical protein
MANLKILGQLGESGIGVAWSIISDFQMFAYTSRQDHWHCRNLIARTFVADNRHVCFEQNRIPIAVPIHR